MAAKSKQIAFLLHQTNTIAHLVLQILSVIQTYQFSRMRILYMITAYNIIKQNKLKRKRRRMQVRRMLRKPRGFRYERSRTEDWWLKMVSDKASARSWKKIFRMSKESFQDLLAKISPFISPEPNSPNYRLMSAEKKLAVTLYYLKDTGSLWMTANTIGLH